MRSLKLNILWCYISEFLGSFRLLVPVWTLFCYHRNLEIADMFILLLAFCISILIFEIPTGAFADKHGARASFIMGGIIQTISDAILIFAGDIWYFAFSQALRGIGETFFSGAQEALIYDSLKSQNEEKKATSVFGRLQACSIAAIVISCLVGPFMASELRESQFQLIIYISISFSLVRILITCLIVNPEIHRAIKPTIISSVKESIHTFRKSPQLLRNFLGFTIVFIPTYIFQQFQQPILVNNSLNVEELGYLYAGIGIVGFILANNAGKLSDKLGVKKLIFLSAAILFIGYVIAITFIEDKAAVLVAVVFIGTPMSLRWPIYSAVQNEFIPSTSRATTFSVLSIFDSAIDVFFIFSLSFLSGFGYPTIFAGCAIVTLLGMSIPFKTASDVEPTRCIR